MQDENQKTADRVLARQFAQEMTLDEVSQVAGGIKHTCDKGDPTGSTCGASDGNPCDLDWWNQT